MSGVGIHCCGWCSHNRPCAAALRCVWKRKAVVVYCCVREGFTDCRKSRRFHASSVGLHFQKSFCAKNPLSTVIAYFTSPLYSFHFHLANKWDTVGLWTCYFIFTKIKTHAKRKALRNWYSAWSHCSRCLFLWDTIDQRAGFSLLRRLGLTDSKVGFQPTGDYTHISHSICWSEQISPRSSDRHGAWFWLSFTQRLKCRWQVVELQLRGLHIGGGSLRWVTSPTGSTAFSWNHPAFKCCVTRARNIFSVVPTTLIRLRFVCLH